MPKNRTDNSADYFNRDDLSSEERFDYFSKVISPDTVVADKFVYSMLKGLNDEKVRQILEETPRPDGFNDKLTALLEDPGWELFFKLKYDYGNDDITKGISDELKDDLKAILGKDWQLPDTKGRKINLLKKACEIGDEIGFRIITHIVQNDPDIIRDTALQTELMEIIAVQVGEKKQNKTLARIMSRAFDIEMPDFGRSSKSKRERTDDEKDRASQRSQIYNHRVEKLKIYYGAADYKLQPNVEVIKPIDTIANCSFIYSDDPEDDKKSFKESLKRAEEKMPLDSFLPAASLLLLDRQKENKIGGKLLIIPDDDRREAFEKETYGVYNSRDTVMSDGSLDTTIHELSHYLVNNVHENSGKPYAEDDKKAKAKFKEMVTEQNQLLEKLLKADPTNTAALEAKEQLVNHIKLYDKSQHDIEYVVRYHQLLASATEKNSQFSVDEISEVLQPMAKWVQNVYMKDLAQYMQDKTQNFTIEKYNYLATELLQREFENPNYLTESHFSPEAVANMAHNSRIDGMSGMEYALQNNHNICGQPAFTFYLQAYLPTTNKKLHEVLGKQDVALKKAIAENMQIGDESALTYALEFHSENKRDQEYILKYAIDTQAEFDVETAMQIAKDDSLTIDGMPAMQYAIENNLNFGGQPAFAFYIQQYIPNSETQTIRSEQEALEWAIEENKSIDGKPVIQWAVDNDYPISSKMVDMTVDQRVRIDGKSAIHAVLENDIQVDGKPGLVWAIEREHSIDAKTPLRWAMENDLKVGGKTALQFAIDDLGMDKNTVLTAAVENDWQVGGKAALQFAIDDLGMDKNTVLTAAVKKDLQVGGMPALQFAIEVLEMDKDKVVTAAVKKDLQVGGKPALQFAIDDLGMDKNALLTSAVKNDLQVSGKPALQFAIDDLGMDKNTVLTAAVENDWQVGGKPAVQFAIEKMGFKAEKILPKMHKNGMLIDSKPVAEWAAKNGYSGIVQETKPIRIDKENIDPAVAPQKSEGQSIISALKVQESNRQTDSDKIVKRSRNAAAAGMG